MVGRAAAAAADAWHETRRPCHLQSADLSPWRKPMVPWAARGHDTHTLGHSVSCSWPQLETNALASQMFSIQNAYESIVIAELHAGSSSLCVGLKEPCRRGFWPRPVCLGVSQELQAGQPQYLTVHIC